MGCNQHLASAMSERVWLAMLLRRSMSCFQGWWAYLKIGIPSSAMVCMEWWSFEVLILLAGLLPDPELSVSVVGICFNLASLIYMISFGLSGACRAAALALVIM